MANFVNQKGDRINSITIPNSQDVRIGLWGFKESKDGPDLKILTSPYLQVSVAEEKGDTRFYRIYGYHPGNWQLDAIDHTGGTWDKLTVTVEEKRPQAGYIPHNVLTAAKASKRKWGVPASIVLAQWILESNWGQAMPKESNNPFGIKAVGDQPRVSAQTEEEKDGVRYTIKSPFRKFESISDAFNEHGKLLATQGQYARAMKLAGDPDAFADALTGIYATASNYGTVLKGLMKRYNLREHDAD